MWTTAGEKRDERDRQRQPRKQLIEGQKTERIDEERILKEVRKRKTVDREVNKLNRVAERENQEGTEPGDRHQYYYYLHHSDYHHCFYYKSHNRKSEVLLFSFGGDFLVS